MRLIFNHPKINNKKEEKGLSLIESAMVLALAATVTAGVMFYYQSASDSNKTQSAISEVMSATSAINGLYIGQSSYDNLSESVLINSSAIPENYKSGTKIMNPFGGELKVGAAASGKGFGYYIALENLPKSACISLATLNLGTSAAGYGVMPNSNSETLKNTELNNPTGGVKTKPISPSDAATMCSSNNGSTNKVVAYFMK